MQKIVGRDGVAEVRWSSIDPARIQRSDIGEDVPAALAYAGRKNPANIGGADAGFGQQLPDHCS